MNLNDLVEDIKPLMLATSRDAELEPIFLLVKDGDYEVVGVKDVAPSIFLPMLLKQQQPEAYVIFFEARMKIGDPNNPPDESIADNPENPSIIGVFSSYRGGPVVFSLAQATREEFPREFMPWREAENPQGRLFQHEW